MGDIEEVAGRIAITCPRHRHKIDIETGQRLDTDLEGCLRVEYGGESVQAVHSVHVDDGWVYVHITHVTGARSSSYNVVHEFVPNTQNNSINGGIAWGLSGDMFSPVKAPFDPLNDTISLSQVWLCA